MDEWGQLTAELDRWHQAGKIATFWWRDDDLSEETLAFRRLLDLRAHFDIPLASAVIPSRLDPDLAGAVDPYCTILQHGYVHQNFAPEGAKKSEFPENRAAGEIADELRAGKELLGRVFTDQFVPIMVPPWNRIADNHIGALPSLGFIGLSRYKARKEALAAPLLAELNTHVDLIDWRGNRSAVRDEMLVDLICGHLSARREGVADPLEPTGLLSHHLVHDEEIWAALYRLLSVLCGHAAVRFVSVQGALALIDGLPEHLSGPGDNGDIA
ncbi:MAG: hypothetical protein CMN55_09545 [Sneathiella sp.]|jgi:hypothetical protein|uniref:polysaccharide deacetylase family protein n=1 Tax=Sneathiella sp. TaxID=1964365 RepID=UPI000C401227|nr:polysaccharide deacetylase family protein [Sneathiella sp.]MAL79340.1 hypothetical protein [Sneathiella sp.]